MQTPSHIALCFMRREEPKRFLSTGPLRQSLNFHLNDPENEDTNWVECEIMQDLDFFVSLDVGNDGRGGIAYLRNETEIACFAHFLFEASLAASAQEPGEVSRRYLNSAPMYRHEGYDEAHLHLHAWYKRVKGEAFVIFKAGRRKWRFSRRQCEEFAEQLLRFHRALLDGFDIRKDNHGELEHWWDSRRGELEQVPVLALPEISTWSIA